MVNFDMQKYCKPYITKEQERADLITKEDISIFIKKDIIEEKQMELF